MLSDGLKSQTNLLFLIKEYLKENGIPSYWGGLSAGVILNIGDPDEPTDIRLQSPWARVCMDGNLRLIGGLRAKEAIELRAEDPEFLDKVLEWVKARVN